MPRLIGLSLLGVGLAGGGCAVDERKLDVVQAPALAAPGAAAAAAPLAGEGGLVSNGNSSEVASLPELAAPSAGAAPPRLLSLGQECSQSSEACEASLRCVSGSCRLPCVTAADCATLGAGVDCSVGMALDGSGVGACDYQSYCDPAHPQAPSAGATACAAGSGCRPSESGQSECQLQPGSGTAGSACNSDADCTADRFCGEYGTCRKYCLSDADCGSDVCSPFPVPRRAGNLAVGFCATPDCDPVHPQAPRDGLSACPVGQGCNSTPEARRTRCEQRTGSGARYDRCSSATDCQPGLLCGGDLLAGYCSQFCFEDADCPGQRCRRFGNAQFAGEHALGACVEVCNPAHPDSSEGGFGACPPGFACGASADGLSVCHLPGSKQPYERCENLKDCPAGHACDQGDYGFCKPVCLSDADCGGGTCVPAGIGAGMADVGRCVEGCSPVDPQSTRAPFRACPPGFGCTLEPDGISRCYLAGAGRTQAACTDSGDCAPGFGCDASGRCYEFCFSSADCEQGTCDAILAPNDMLQGRVVRGCVR